MVFLWNTVSLRRFMHAAISMRYVPGCLNFMSLVQKVKKGYQSRMV